MTTTDVSAPRSGFPWLKLALVLSLAMNLLFVGGGLARYYFYGGPERMPPMSQMQFFPRKFFGDLDRGRRAELLQVFKDYGPRFRQGRAAGRTAILNLASALEAEPYDPARVKAAVDAFSANGTGLIATGGEAAITLIAKLTPDERRMLARHIRGRDEAFRKRGDDGRGPDGPPGGD